MKNLTFLLIAIMVFGFLISNIHLGLAQTSTPVNGIINSDTTWTKANSPYNLTGNLLINNEVTLTIEPGVILNLNNHVILVNGTLAARGSSNNEITFQSGGSITFTQYSTGWNQQTSSGSIIEYSVFKETAYTLLSVGINGGSPMIRSNDMTASISITGGSPIISSNKFTSFSYTDVYGRQQGVENQIGISGNTNAYIADNNMDGYISIQSGTPTILRNLITAGIGIDMSTITSFANPTIESNTITNCGYGIYVGGNSVGLTLLNNNFIDNSKYDVFWQSTDNLNATYNWWGTTDQSAISNLIYDFNNNFNLGTVNFVPFLTAPNPQATPNSNAPIPTPNLSPTSTSTPMPTSNASPSSTSTPIVPEFSSVIIIATVLLIAALSIAVYKGKLLLEKKNKKGLSKFP